MQRGSGRGSGRGDFRGGGGRSRGGRGGGSPPSGSEGRGGSPSRGFEGRGGPPSRGFEGRGGPPSRGFEGRGGPPRGFEGRGRGSGPPNRGRGGPPPSTGPLIFNPGNDAREDMQMKAAEDSLVRGFKTMSIQQANELALRPGYGTKGTPIVLRTNHFPCVSPKGLFYEYKIYYEPAVKVKRVRRRLLEILEDAPAFQAYKDHVAHDWSEKLISTKKLPSPNQNPFEVQIKHFDENEELNDRSKMYTLSFSFTRELAFPEIDNHLKGTERQNIAPFVAALNIMLAKTAAKSGIKVGRDRYFFKSEGSFMNLGGGLEAWKGFYSSVRPSLNSLMVNVNVCYTAFYKPGRLSDAIEEFQRASFAADPARFVDRLRVQPTHLSYHTKKTICGLAKPAGKCTFLCEEFGGNITVQEYFLRKYNIRLQHPKWVVNIGRRDNPRYLPAELAEIIPNQAFRGKLLDSHTAEMIRFACRRPSDNARSITNEGLSLLGFLGQASQVLTNLGINVATEMATVPARVLSPPRLEFGGGKFAKIDNDKASWNLARVKFYKPQQLKSWGIFIINTSSGDFQGPQDGELLQLIQSFRQGASDVGISIVEAPTILGANLNPNQQGREIHSFLSNKLQPAVDRKLNFVLVILSTGAKDVYASIRRICDVELGITATCVQSQKVRKERGQQQYLANVCLKINAKLGGVNYSLDSTSAAWLKQELTMLVGMDVTHPGPGSIKGTPSIAGVVASCDENFALYPASLRLQKTKQEMIDELTEMMVERLMVFRERRKTLPKRIIIFRDGVSEGQFLTVLEHELPKILAACKKMSTPNIPYKPKLTIIICGKRHHTRFYPTSEDSADHLGNPKPGTVVDRGITAIFEFDFYLQAHSGLQGAARPTHYTVIYDENKFDADAAQCLVNYASYTYVRATRAVSLVPPAYYADLACERGRLYIQEYLNAAEGGSSSGRSGGDEDAVFSEVKKRWGRGIHPNICPTMFYV